MSDSKAVAQYLSQLDIPQGIKQSQSRIAVRLLALVEAEQEDPAFIRQYRESNLTGKAKYIEAMIKLANIPVAKPSISNVITATTNQVDGSANTGILFAFESGVDPNVTDAMYRDCDDDYTQDEKSDEPIQTQGHGNKRTPNDDLNVSETHTQRTTHSAPPVDTNKGKQQSKPSEQYPIELIEVSDIDTERDRVKRVFANLDKQAQS